MSVKILSHSIVRQDFLKNLIEENTKIKAQIQKAANFIKDIEDGKFDTEYKHEGDSENQLITALLSMQNQLKKISEEEKNRNWATEGLAKFADILRKNNDNIHQLSDRIISNLVKYLGANQGGIFVLNEDDPSEMFLELIACYAYDRKKYLERNIKIGEGLVGQTFIEQETIYMTELPQNYTSITSGLGDATPKNLVLIPLKVNDEVLGVLELASFNLLEKHQLDFLEKVGESIASTLTAARVSHKTEKLLQESQIQTEQLRSQEEEVRQNMEELSATQEEIQRVLKEVQNKEQYLNELINVPKDSIFTIDKNFKLLSFNKSFSIALEAAGLKIDKGFDFMQIFPEEQEKRKQRALYERAFKGENFEQTDEYEINGQTLYYLANYAPLYNEQGEIFAAACFSKDVTELVRAQKKSEELLLQSKQQAKEMQQILQEAQEKEHYLDELINVPKDTIFTVDKDYKVLSCNKSLSTSLEAMGIKVEKGFDILLLFPEEKDRKKQIELYKRAFNGENFEQTDSYGEGDQIMYYSSNLAPLYDDKGEVFAVASFSKDVTTLVKAQKEAEALLRESTQQREEMQAQEEELRQNMEELTATQEEMQRVLLEAKESDIYMQSFINASDDPVVAVDKDLKMLVFNNALVDSFKVLGKNVKKFDSIIDYLNPENKEKQLEVYRKTLKGEKFEMVKQYGERTLDIKYSPIKDDKENIIGVCCFTRDITKYQNEKKMISKTA